jgi:hypothetical protein
MRGVSWLVALAGAILLAGVPGCGGHDTYIAVTPSDPGGSWLHVSNDAGYIGEQTGDYRTKH